MEGAEGSDGERPALDGENGRTLFRGESAGAIPAGEGDRPSEVNHSSLDETSS